MMSKVIHYTVGLAFTETRKQMVVILKDRPAFQKGKYNGVGGKMETKDYQNADNRESKGKIHDVYVWPEQIAISREFEEETSCKTDPKEWRYFAEVTILNDQLGGKAVIHCLTRSNNDVFNCRTMETEKVELHTVTDICTKMEVAPNLPMLIAIALNDSVSFVKITLNQ